MVPLKDDEGRTIGVVPMRGRRRTAKKRVKCVACRKRVAVYACGHALGDGEIRFGHQTECEAPLCAKCRREGSDGADYCPIHQDQSAQPSLF